MKTCLEVINSVKDAELKGNLLLSVPAENHNKPIAGLRNLLLSFSWANSKQGFDYWEGVYSRLVGCEKITL